MICGDPSLNAREGEIMKDTVFKSMREKMENAVASLHHDFGTIRTGRASPAFLDKVLVDYYGNKTPISQVANISVPDSKLILIQPWDVNLLPAIEKAIMVADLGVTPGNDGKVIRIAIPPFDGGEKEGVCQAGKANGGGYQGLYQECQARRE